MQFFPKNFIAATKDYTTMEHYVPAPYFRKTFSFKKGKRAKIRICGLGFYELYINGKNVTKGRLSPYISNPDQALFYDDYDVTEHLFDGENVVGVWLGNGFQNNPYGDVWDFDKASFRSAPKFAMAFWEDGALRFESDTSFLTKPSPIVFDDYRAGEHYDAREETPSWNTLACDESGWKPAILATTPSGEARLVSAEPIVVKGEVKPVSVVKTPKGAHLYDFGLVFTGVCRLKVQGERGQMLRLTHGEILLHGDLDIRGVGFDRFQGRELFTQCDWYVLKGEGVEEYTPRFTYHGFQYVSVEGLTDEQATPDLLTFEILHEDVQSRGDFTCSDEMLNILQASVRRSDLSNFHYVPTDCPQREKNGWTGDIALSAEQMTLNFDVKNLMSDWLFSVRKAQDSRGAIPAIVPTAGWGYAWGAGPNWDDALLEVPYQLYRYYGDKKIINDNLSAIETYLRYMLTKRKGNGLFEYGLGDWCQPGSEYQFTTPTELTDSIKCMDMCAKAAAMAKVVGENELAIFAQNTAEDIRKAVVAAYIKDGKSTCTEQTGLAYLLYYGVAEDCKAALQAQLLESIARAGGVFTTGVLGARTLFRVLTDMGEGDLAYTLITQPKYPSYGLHVLRGARSLLENFFVLEEGSFQCKNGRKQDSFNHHFWGDISAWFIAYIAGIKINPYFDDCAYVEIAPNFLSALAFAEGKTTSAKGEVFSCWARLKDGTIALLVRLPKGAKGKVRLPSGYVCESETLFEGEQKMTIKRA